MHFYKLMLVGLGGFAGSVARYLATRSIDSRYATALPLGTLAVNVVGSFLLGIVWSWVSRHGDNNGNIKLLFITGVCGGFTTFSAFAFENMNLINAKLPWVSVIYITTSLVLGVLAVVGGIFVGKYL